MIGHKARDCKNKLCHNGGQNGGNQQKFQVNQNNSAYCTYCCRPGHHKVNCFKLKNRNNRNGSTGGNENQEQRIFNSNDVAFPSIASDDKITNNMWIFDSGASCHYCQSMEGLTDVKDIDELIKIGNGEVMRACKTGNLNCEVTQLDGKKFVITLTNVKYVPEICANLFSLNKALKNGFKLSNSDIIVSLTKKHVTLTFD